MPSRRSLPPSPRSGIIDSRTGAMARDWAAMEAELDRIQPMLSLSRYIPFPDHLIPSDVSWDNFQYFVWRWKEMVGA